MKGNGKIIKCMEKGNSFGLMGVGMREAILMTLKMVMDKCSGQMGKLIKVNGGMDFNQEMECIVTNREYGGKGSG